MRFCPRLVSTPEATYKDLRVMSGKPLYVGEAVAAVAAKSGEEDQRALEAIKVEYDPLEQCLDALESMELDMPLLHDTVILNDDEIRVENNVACKLEITEGDVEEGRGHRRMGVKNPVKTHQTDRILNI